MASEAYQQARNEEALSPKRRRFLVGVSVLLGAFASVIVGVPIVGFLVGPWFTPAAAVWRAVGKVDDFKVGDTAHVAFDDAASEPWAGIAGRTAAWLRRDSATQFIAFAVNCTHLGCPVRWEQGAQLFLCPCHGGVYYADGEVAAGPPPLPLPRYPVRINNGQVEILAASLPLPSNEGSQLSNYGRGAAGGR